MTALNIEGMQELNETRLMEVNGGSWALMFPVVGALFTATTVGLKATGVDSITS